MRKVWSPTLKLLFLSYLWRPTRPRLSCQTMTEAFRHRDGVERVVMPEVRERCFASHDLGRSPQVLVRSLPGCWEGGEGGGGILGALVRCRFLPFVLIFVFVFSCPDGVFCLHLVDVSWRTRLPRHRIPSLPSRCALVPGGHIPRP